MLEEEKNSNTFKNQAARETRGFTFNNEKNTKIESGKNESPIPKHRVV